LVKFCKFHDVRKFVHKIFGAWNGSKTANPDEVQIAFLASPRGWGVFNPWTGNHTSIPMQRFAVGGRPVIKGTRVTVEMILEDLAQGATAQDILRSYPHLPKEAVMASLSFASEMIRSEAFHLDA